MPFAQGFTIEQLKTYGSNLVQEVTEMWVLIIVMVSVGHGGIRSVVIEFENSTLCNSAKQAVESIVVKNTSADRIQAVCVKRKDYKE